MSDGRYVHIVDDDDSVRGSIAFLLSASGYAVERWADGESFFKGADKSGRACMLLDIRMPGSNGLDIQERMLREGWDCPVIVITGHGGIDLAVRAMKAHAVDFLEKPFDREGLLRSIEAAFKRLDDRDAKRIQGELAAIQLGRLTAREREVLDGLACGYPNKTIAYDLKISTRTVEGYRASLMTKLGLHFFADALRLAFAGGLGSEELWRERHCSRH